MIRPLLAFFFLFGAFSSLVAQQTGEQNAATEQPKPSVEAAGPKFYVIPVQDGIGKPTLFAIRNGVKDAIEVEADFVVLDMNTPGGEVGSTLEIMKVLERFPGQTITYINEDAVSAGSFIAASTNQIWFAQGGVIGAAAPVAGGGQEIDETMRQKVVSYLKARIRAMSEDYRYRGAVISAMIDSDVELVVEGETLKEKGELLSLTASEAIKLYGEPPVPLLGEGIADTIDSLMASLSNGEDYTVQRFESTWSLDMAHFLVKLAPVLLGIGVLTIYIEMQTPGFGIPGIVGVFAFVIAIFGHNVAGLSGQEPLLFFILGALLLFAEIFLMPGTFFLAVPGLLLMIGSLIWSMTDVWPSNTPDFEWEVSMFRRPLINLMLGFALGIASIAALARFLPRSMFWGGLVLSETIAGSAQEAGAAQVEPGSAADKLIGVLGVAATDLYPAGQIEIEGVRYEAHSSSGMLDKGASVRVIARNSFGYEVEEVTS